MLLFCALVIGILWLISGAMSGGSGSHFLALVAIPVHFAGWWLLAIPLIVWLVAALLVFRSLRPLALRRYLRDARNELEVYRRASTSLDALNEAYTSTITYYAQATTTSLPPAARELTPVELARTCDSSLLLSGEHGSGKTLTLRLCQQVALSSRAAGQQTTIPVFVSLRDYGLLLKASRQQTAEAESGPNVSLLDFLLQDQGTAIRHLHPYLRRLMERGHLLLLCDGLDEVDRDVRPTVASELAELLLMTQNRLVIACRAFDYRDQQALSRLVDDHLVDLAVIEPLSLEQIRDFVERYIESQGDHWRHTAGQIMQVIAQSRMYRLCQTPLLLFAFLAVIDRAGIQRGQLLDTRGRLLQAYVSRLFSDQQASTPPKTPALNEQTGDDSVAALGRLACDLRLAGGVDALLLPSSASSHDLPGKLQVKNAVREWQDQHGVAETLPALDEERLAIAEAALAARDARLLDVTSLNGRGGARGLILEYRHPLLADYCIAAFLLARSLDKQSAFDPIFAAMLAHVEEYCVALALWAGLSDDPPQLAEQLVTWGQAHEEKSLLSLLIASLTCIGVAWKSPQAGAQQEESVPPRVTALLRQIMADRAASQDFARLFTRCVDEGAQELLFSLLPLVSVDGVDDLFMLLDPGDVSQLLFDYLCDIIDVPSYDAQVRRVCHLLWNCGAEAVPRAGALSQPETGRSLRLRTAAINILGGTRDAAAVEPLIACLGDAEPYIVNRAIYALARLGPDLSLPALLQALTQRLPDPSLVHKRLGILAVLERFLQARQSTPHHEVYQVILRAVIDLLSTDYATEPAVQQQARALLARQCRPVQGQQAQPLPPSVQQAVVETIVPALLPYLASSDDVMARNAAQTLREIGSVAIPLFAAALNRQPPVPDIVRMRLVDLLKDARDPTALSALLRCIADPAPSVQQQLAAALRFYVPESISGLIDVVLSTESMAVAGRASQILASIGSEAVEPVARALLPIVPSRTRLLVEILAQAHDPRAVPSLINLLKTLRDMDTPQAGLTLPDLVLLCVTVIRVLGQLADRRAVAPLIQALSFQQPQLYEEAIDALSRPELGAFDGLLAALDAPEDSTVAARARRALLGMQPFPGEALIEAWRTCSEAQARQIMLTLQAQGAEAASLLVQHLFDQDTRARQYVYQTLTGMPGAIVVPPLLEALDQPSWRNAVTLLLLRYEEAIPLLVDLLGDPDRAPIAAGILQRYGPEMLPPLISALDDPRITVQEYAQHILLSFARKDTARIADIVKLFGDTLPLRAHEALLETLVNDLAAASIPALLDGLEDAHLVPDVAEALTRLAHKPDWQFEVINTLLDALRDDARRRGAETALIKIGAPAVSSVGALMTDADQQVAESAQRILREIGAPALPFIWAAHSDASDPRRQEAAMHVFQTMPTEDIRQALVGLLDSDRSEDMSLALALLMERVNDEKSQPPTAQEMIPSLLDYVQIHEQEPASLRILAMLLLLGDETVVKHLSRELYDHPEHHQMLAHAFLFLGEGARSALESIVNDANADADIRSEAIAMLGLLHPTPAVYDYAQSLSQHGLFARQASVVSSEQLSIALRALGGLLASGTWDVQTLQNMRRLSTQGSPQEELFSVLLGWRNAPELDNARRALEMEREAHKAELMKLADRLVEDQHHISELRRELQQVQLEHGQRGDELYKIAQEREDAHDQLARVLQERELLQEQIEQLQTYNTQLLRELDQLRASQNA